MPLDWRQVRCGLEARESFSISETFVRSPDDRWNTCARRLHIESTRNPDIRYRNWNERK